VACPEMQMDEEATLVRRAQQGDDEAFRLLFRQHTDSLRAYVLRRISPALRRKASAADILQETFLVASQRIGDFENRGDGCFAGWLRTIAENRTRKLIEHFAGTAKRNLSRELSGHARAETGQFIGHRTSPSAAAMGRELQDAAQRALLELPDDYREVLRLLQEQDRSFPDAAAHMQRSVAATRKLYARALARFSALLQSYTGDAQ